MTATFYLLAASTLATLVLRIGKASTFRERAPFYLFFFLYFGLFAYPFLWADAPRWFQGMNITLFSGGQLWLLAEPLASAFQNRRQSTAALRGLKKEKGGLYEVVVATRLLSQTKLGALIVIERRQSLNSWCDKGIQVDAKLSREIIFSIFTPPGTLHDGAAVIRKDRLAACGVIVPLTHANHFPKELGTRHRAAVGFSEVTDALCLVVSEESGSVSIADRGSLYYDIPFEKLPRLLERALRFQLHKNKSLIQTLEVVGS